MSDPRWTDETAETVALAMGAHHLDPNWLNADRHSRCICKAWAEGEMEPGWDDHMAEVALAALADAGLLVEPGGETRQEWSTTETVADGGGVTRDEDRARQWLHIDVDRWYRDSKLVRRTVHIGPWREAS